MTALISHPADTKAGNAIESLATGNTAFGLDLYARLKTADGNLFFSPYSISTCLAMTYAGAQGDTAAQMAKTLHFDTYQLQLATSFGELQKQLNSEQEKKGIELNIANDLWGQKDHLFLPTFLDIAKQSYGANLKQVDFRTHADTARTEINDWVNHKTKGKITDLIQPGVLGPATRLVLVNAIYLKAPWMEVFPEHATKPAPFHLAGGAAQDAPMMVRQGHFGYARGEGYSAITIPYTGGDLQFLVLLPDALDGLAALETKLTPDQLAACASTKSTDVILHLPKFKMEPPLFRLGKVLQALGMKSAFDQPKGSANFDRLAPRKPEDYLFISEVFHKTFLDLDEKGTEAAAATAVVMARATAMLMDPPKPIEVRVDHPFLFAIQHRPSGACLFVGRITQPR